MILNYKGEMIDEVNRMGVDLQTTENDLERVWRGFFCISVSDMCTSTIIRRHTSK